MLLRLAALRIAFVALALFCWVLAAPLPRAAAPCDINDNACLTALVTRANPYLWHSSAPRAASAAIAAQAKEIGGDVLELYRLRYEEVEADGLSSQVVQRVFYLPTAAGAHTFDNDDFWYDSSRWTFRLWQGVVRHADGTSDDIGDAGDADPHGLGNRARGLAMPALRGGDVIDIVYVLTPVAPQAWAALGTGYLGDLFAFEDSYPAERVTYVLRSRQPIAVAAVGLPAAAAASEPGGWTRYLWSAGPEPAYWPDADGPSITDSSPYVQTGSFSGWGGLVDWYSAQLAARGALSPDFRARLRAIVPPQATPLATVRAIWNYLAAHLDYEGAETGVHGFLPAPPEEVFRARQGDCKDGALLMAAWLRADGIPADLALVRTWKMGGVADAAATIAAFDHAILYVPELELWVDTTAPNLTVGELPASDQGALALVVAPGQDRLRHIPVLAADANTVTRDIQLTPHGGEQWEMTGTIVATGAKAEDWRSEIYAENTAALVRWVRGYFPRSRLLATSAEPGPGAVRLHFRALIPRRDFSGDLTLFPARYANLLASERERREPKRLPVRWQVTDRWTLPVAACPGHAAAASAGAGGAADPLTSPFGALAVARSCDAGTMTTTVRVTQAATEIEPDQYPSFRAFWRAVDARLAPASGATPVLAAAAPTVAVPASASPESK